MQIITIIGSTGTQGYSVAETFLSLKDWTVRCVTRNTSSAKAQSLAKLGADIVQGDLEDIDSLSSAFKDANAIFVNTDFWAPYRALIESGVSREEASQTAYETEVRHAKNAAHAASNIPTLRVYVYSALGPMKKASSGKYHHSYHWETKAAAVEHVQNMPSLAAKASFIYIGCYATNSFLLPKQDNGVYKMTLPADKDKMVMPIIDVPRNTGLYVRCLVEDEEPGTKLVAGDSTISMAEALAAWCAATGESAEYNQVDYETMHKVSGLPYEVLDGAAYLGEYSYTAGLENVIETKDLKNPPRVDSYAEYLKKQNLSALVGVEYQKL